MYLRSTWGFDGVSQFSYSRDGETYEPVGEAYPLTWGSYRGDRVGIFTVNATKAEGLVDVDSFVYHIEH